MKLTYWISTVITSIYLLWSSYGYLFSDSVKAGIKDLGFPDFFRIELAVLKIIAALLILFPQIPMLLKEGAYIGVALFYLTAFIAHYVHKDPFYLNLINLILLTILIVSRISLPKAL